MIKQPVGSSLCGQCCLGEILFITLEESIKLVGHKHGTYTRELTPHFLGVSTKVKMGFPDKYSLCTVHYKEHKFKHWVLFNKECDGKDSIYDPCIGFWVTYENWVVAFGVTPRITSHVEIPTILKHK